MLRSLILASALFAAPAALACGGADCASCDKHAAVDGDNVDTAEGTKITIAVSGMKCGKCSAKVTAALKAVDGVTAVNVDHESGQAKLAFDADKVDQAKLIETITGLGYTATPAV